MSMWSLEWQEVVDNVRQEEYMKNLLWVDDFPDVQNGGPAVAGGASGPTYNRQNQKSDSPSIKCC